MSKVEKEQVAVSIRMDAAEKRDFEKFAQKNGRSLSSEARIAILSHMKKAK
jgi:uncharacterized tellurite resistance protein B-like protein